MLKEAQEVGRRTKRSLQSAMRLLVPVLLVLVVAHLANFSFGYGLNQFGIIPRSTDGLVGIAASPFLHVSFAHLGANLVGFLLFATPVALRGRKDFFYALIFGVVLGGLGTWLFGNLFRPMAIHVGASGVVFAFFGYAVSIGFFERKFLSVVVSIALLLAFGGTLRGILPGSEGISWEGHLFGALAGIYAARLASQKA